MRFRAFERGMALISALLLLLVTTMLGVAMFRSFGFLEAVAGNTREKQRALHAAQAAQDYAEWWTTQSQGQNATAGKTCPSGIDSNLANVTPCNIVLANPAQLPWATGFAYTPPGMSTGASNIGTAGNFIRAPVFYISFISNIFKTSNGTQINTFTYQIDAAGNAGTTNSAAVVESMYQVSTSYTAANGPKKYLSLGGP